MEQKFVLGLGLPQFWGYEDEEADYGEFRNSFFHCLACFMIEYLLLTHITQLSSFAAYYFLRRRFVRFAL